MGKSIASISFVLFGAVTAAGQWGAPPLDPFTVKSASGEYSVWESPAAMNGYGAATYRLSRNGHLLWQRILPFAFLKLAVSNSGVFGGYGDVETKARKSQLLIALISPDGSIRLRHLEDFGPHIADGPANPNAWSVHVDDALGRLVVCVHAGISPRSAEEWRCYRLSDGARLPSVMPEALPGRGVMVAAAAVPDTSYTLANWLTGEDQTDGAFTLMNQTGHIVWRRDMPGDYQGIADPEPMFSRSEEIFYKGAIVSVARYGEFEVRFVKLGKAVRFRVDPHSGRVTEIGRAPLIEHVPKKVDIAKIPNVSLKSTRKFVFPLTPGADSPVHDVEEFCFLSNGHIALLRISPAVSVAEIDRSGRLIREASAPFSAHERVPFARLDDNHFVLGQSSNAVGEPSVVWQVDLSSGHASPMFKAPSGLLEGVINDGKGGIAVEGEATLYDIDRAGHLHWKTEAVGGEGLTIDAMGRFLTVDPVSHAISQFDSAGKSLGYKDLNPILGLNAGYTCRLTLLGNGSIAVDNMDSLAIFDGEYHLRYQFTPHLPNGGDLPRNATTQVDANDDLWVTNGKCLYRLDAKGVATAMIGMASDKSAFGAVGGLTVDRHGAIYAVNSVNGDVLVFDHSGHLRRRVTAPPGKLDQLPVNDASVDVAASGDIYVNYGSARSEVKFGQWHFSPTGRGLGFQEYDREPPISDSASIGPDARWYRSALIDGEGKVRNRIDHWPDGSWLDVWKFEPVVIAPDGQVAIVSGKFGENGWHPYRLGFFAPNGRPISMTSAPVPIVDNGKALGYDGTLLYFYDGKVMFAVNRTGEPVWKFTTPPATGFQYKILPWAGGIGFYDGAATIYWYDKPK